MLAAKFKKRYNWRDGFYKLKPIIQSSLVIAIAIKRPHHEMVWAFSLRLLIVYGEYVEAISEGDLD